MVTATDINSKVLEIAKQKTYPRQNVTFDVANIYALPEPKQSFDTGFGGFIWSHIPLSRLPGFLASFHQYVGKGSKIVFIDNRYVAGSSTPLSTWDNEGNTFQERQLESGESYVVLKNFPSEKELRTTLGNTAHDIQITFLTYHWILTYIIA